MPSLLKFPHNAFALMNVASAADRNEARVGSIHSYMWVERAGVRATLHCTLILLSAPPSSSSYMSDILGEREGTNDVYDP